MEIVAACLHCAQDGAQEKLDRSKSAAPTLQILAKQMQSISGFALDFCFWARLALLLSPIQVFAQCFVAGSLERRHDAAQLVRQADDTNRAQFLAACAKSGFVLTSYQSPTAGLPSAHRPTTPPP